VATDGIGPCFLPSEEPAPTNPSIVVNPTREKTNEPKKNETQ
jgi:hypothetical protein